MMSAKQQLSKLLMHTQLTQAAFTMQHGRDSAYGTERAVLLHLGNLRKSALNCPRSTLGDSTRWVTSCRRSSRALPGTVPFTSAAAARVSRQIVSNRCSTPRRIWAPSSAAE